MAGEARGLVVTAQRKGDCFTIQAFITPRREGGPNLAAFDAAMRALALVVPDAYDPVTPSAASVPAQTLTPAHIAEAMLRDGVVPPPDDEWIPHPIGACATGGCQGD